MQKTYQGFVHVERGLLGAVILSTIVDLITKGKSRTLDLEQIALETGEDIEDVRRAFQLLTVREEVVVNGAVDDYPTVYKIDRFAFTLEADRSQGTLPLEEKPGRLPNRTVASGFGQDETDLLIGKVQPHDQGAELTIIRRDDEKPVFTEVYIAPEAAWSAFDEYVAGYTVTPKKGGKAK